MNKVKRLQLLLACCAVLSFSSAVAFGQASASPAAATDQTTTTTQSTAADQGDRHDHSNWGWLGLLGLLGLGGLMKRRENDVYDRDNRTERKRSATV